MTEEKHNWLGPYIPEGSFFREVIQQIKLAFALLLDPRVHPITKLIPLAAVGYLLLPTDIIPDVIPVLGQMDDLVVMMLGLRLFFEFSPAPVVQEHLQRLVQRVKSDWSVVDNAPPDGDRPADGGEVIDDGK
jgi:uncharacterized membrane protein YkvA (DUF1232 family)